jgi:FtsH-binding integral membrane protein
LTFAILIALVVYTVTSKKDFGWMGQSLASGLWVLLIAGFLQVKLKHFY